VGCCLWVAAEIFVKKVRPYREMATTAECGVNVSQGSGRPEVAESQNHRMVGVGRDLCGSPSPTLLPKQGHLQ